MSVSCLRSSLAKACLPFALLSLSACAAQPPAVADAAPAPAPAADLVAAVDIPYEKFTLDNGLTVLVHEDRKAPLVAVSVWYGVGSKNEPKGKAGYAHLFEHIMFNGSENAPDDYFTYLKQLGATSFNGSTWFDRTNYYQTVPSSALESVLFLESDRMGNLLGAVTQAKLDNQIGVVQNEKRQGDNEPYGLFDYVQTEMLFPPSHPYSHMTIGSMEDLSAASLDDMRSWFKGHYGPNNAILALAGDISAAEARPLVEKWFGRFQPGPKVAKIDPPVPTLPRREARTIYDQVPNARIAYSWAVPGLNDPSNVPLTVAADVLGGLLSSRLDNLLVRQEQLAVSVRAVLQSFENASIFEVRADVKNGVDPDTVAARLDAILADFIANGPTEDEVARVATDTAADKIAGLDFLAAKASELAEGELYSGDPAFYKKSLEALAAVKPADVRAAMQTWLTRPLAEIRVLPGGRGPGPYGAKLAEGEVAPEEGERTPLEDAATAEADTDDAAAEPTEIPEQEVEAAPGGDRAAADPLATFPLPTQTVDLDFPTVQTATLDNGVPVYFARRAGVPVVRVVASFEGGYSADDKGAEGTAAFASRVMQEGTESRDSTALAEDQERLGATLFGGSSLEETTFGVRAVTPNLDASVALLADVVRNPAFDAAEIERVRAQQLSNIEAEASEPSSLVLRALPPIIYGDRSRYGVPFTGTGYGDVVAGLDAAALRGFQQAWIRPDNMKLFVIGDTDLAAMMPVLNRHFGDWQAPATPRGTARADATPPEQQPRIIVYDRPQSPQSYIMAGEVLPVKGTEELAALNISNNVLGGDFLSRINMDLREEKGWSYGARSAILRPKGLVPFLAYAPVQADETVPALKVMRQLIRDVTGPEPISEAERDRVVNAAILELPGQFETSLAVLAQMQADVKYGRPFDYAEGAADRYRALGVAELNAALPSIVRPDALVWIIVGDADIIRPQLKRIDLPVEYRSLED